MTTKRCPSCNGVLYVDGRRGIPIEQVEAVHADTCPGQVPRRKKRDDPTQSE